MASTNKVFIKGNLGSDPELRHTQDGRPVCQLRVATNEKWNNREGERIEHTEWHRTVVFGRLAEVAAEYLSKGSTVIAWGKLRTRKYVDRDGNERSVTEIHVDELDFVGGRRQSGSDGDYRQQQPQAQQSQPQPQPQRPQPRQPQPQQPAPAQGGDEDFFEDDIPF